MCALLWLMPSIAVFAQKGPVSAGGDATGAGGSVSYSIGEIDFETVNGLGGTITEGIQQPYEIYVVVGVDDPEWGASVLVYPNPAQEWVVLDVGELDL